MDNKKYREKILQSALPQIRERAYKMVGPDCELADLAAAVVVTRDRRALVTVKRREDMARRLREDFADGIDTVVARLDESCAPGVLRVVVRLADGATFIDSLHVATPTKPHERN
jgi:hypothetical protein